MNGIICIDKPEGFTSFDVVAKLRGILKMKRIGHGGTLDPMATGVLPIFLGTATKICDMLPNDIKAYSASFVLGTVTDTLDITGTVLKKTEVDVSLSHIEDVIQKYCGEITQIPPMYSAVSVNGQKLYKLARQGITVERPSRKVIIHSIDLKEFDEKSFTAKIDVCCSKGTYIRTLIDDIGTDLGCGACMTALKRTASCGFTLSDCMSFDEVSELFSNQMLENRLLPIEKVFDDCPKILLSQNDTQKYKNGAKLPFDSLNFSEISSCRYGVFGFDNEFLGTAILDFEDRVLRIEKNFYSR